MDPGQYSLLGSKVLLYLAKRIIRNGLATGRISDTGDKDKEKANLHGSWSGTLTYMALLDQIGRCFRRKDKVLKSDQKGNIERRGFLITLELFTNLESKKRFALDALRCSFSHEF